MGIRKNIFSFSAKIAPRTLLRVAQRVRGQPADRLPRGSVRFGDLGRLSPIAADFGCERGKPIDRYYIEKFLSQHAGDIQGRVLEAEDNHYTVQFGNARVRRSDVLSIDRTNQFATIVGDLAQSSTLPAEAFDCIILTQVLQYVYDLKAAIVTLHRALKPGGILLLTVPAVTPLPQNSWPWYWAFSAVALRRLLEDQFGKGTALIENHGNVFIATAFLFGLASAEVTDLQYDYQDPNFPIIVSARVVK